MKEVKHFCIVNAEGMNTCILDDEKVGSVRTDKSFLSMNWRRKSLRGMKFKSPMYDFISGIFLILRIYLLYESGTKWTRNIFHLKVVGHSSKLLRQGFLLKKKKKKTTTRKLRHSGKISKHKEHSYPERLNKLRGFNFFKLSRTFSHSTTTTTQFSSFLANLPLPR